MGGRTSGSLGASSVAKAAHVDPDADMTERPGTGPQRDHFAVPPAGAPSCPVAQDTYRLVRGNAVTPCIRTERNTVTMIVSSTSFTPPPISACRMITANTIDARPRGPN